MAFGVLFAVVMSSTPAAQAVLTSTETHCRALTAFHTQLELFHPRLLDRGP